MVLMAEPLAQSVEAARAAQQAAGWGGSHVIALSASGAPLKDARVRALAAAGIHQPPHHAQALVLVCGRYEGIDQRFLDTLVDEQICIGDFVVSGGELPAMVLIDAIVRHLPGTMKAVSADDESFSNGLLDAPHYTRPEVWRDQTVPEVLLSGHHARIAAWRQQASKALTLRIRPELAPIQAEAAVPTPLARPRKSR
jgi:tRNA (guanine37-N1)-methyltransferase